jgi:uncharacterized protein
MQQPAPAALPLQRTRDSAFSYVCGACSRCCYGKRIRVGPYELARLADNRGVTTTRLIERFTAEGGTALAVRPDGGCVFLGERGCTVHADRPLACRLYPLGRIAQADGGERFVDHEPHPRTAGLYGREATVADYLELQGVEPYLAASDLYYELLVRMVDAFESMPGGPAGLDEADDGADAGAVSPVASRFLDVDRAVDAECARTGAPRPPDVQGRMEMHLELLGHWLAALEANAGVPPDQPRREGVRMGSDLPAPRQSAVADRGSSSPSGVSVS